MLRFVVLLCAVSCALGAAIPDGMLPQLDGRIVGGVTTNIRDIPYQASIELNGRHYCGGSIFSHIFAITAAHCMQSGPASVYMVRVGSSFCNSGGVSRKVDYYQNHEGYNSRTMFNDISVVKMSASLIMSSDIQPIALATTAPANGAAAIVSGWGTTSSGGSSPSQLKSVQVDIVSQSRCKNDYGYGSEIGLSMICAYAVGKDSCQGDSGGPLACDGVLAGVVSWGYGCARPNYPGVYADVAYFSPWIKRVTSDF